MPKSKSPLQWKLAAHERPLTPSRLARLRRLLGADGYTAAEAETILTGYALQLPPELQPESAAAIREHKERHEAAARETAEKEIEKRVAARTGSDRILLIDEVRRITGLGRTTIWELERAGLFPKRTKRTRASGRAVGWHESEVRRWVAERK